jgi:hypothetical protein
VLRGRACARPQVVVVSLCEIEKPAVVPEVVRQKLGVAVESEATDDERIEVPREEVRQVEGRGLGVVELLPGVVAREEPVAVRAGQSLDSVSVEHLVELAARAAVGIRNEHPLVAARELLQLRVHCGCDQLRPGMELRGKAADGHVLPPVQPDDGEHLARERAARENEHLGPLGLEDALLVRMQ